MSDVPGVRERVQAFLTSQGPVQIDERNRYGLEIGSTKVFVEVIEHPNGEATLVKLLAPILFKVPITPEVYKYVALHADDWYFGSLGLWPEESGDVGMLVMGHTLLGDYLDKDELMSAVWAVAGTADKLDDELKAQFGGLRYEDS
jgi:hypothetical protein